MRGFLDIKVRGLRLFRENHINVMVTVHFSVSSRNTVGIEHHDHIDAGVAGIVRHQVKQPVPCGLDVRFRQFLQLFPGKNNIVAVHEKEFLNLLPGGLPARPLPGTVPSAVFLCTRRTVLPRPFSGFRIRARIPGRSTGSAF